MSLFAMASWLPQRDLVTLLGTVMTGSKRLATIRRNIKWGVSGGLGIAACYCVWVIGIYLIRGDEPFTRQGATLGKVLAVYVWGGALGGLIVGLLRPMAEDEVGALVVGLLAGIPIAAGIVTCVVGWPWSAKERHIFPMWVLIVGAVVGFLLSKKAEERRKRAERQDQ